MSRTILSEYTALITDTIAYLKEIPSPLLLSKEERQSPRPQPSFHKETIMPPTRPKTEQSHIKPVLQKLGVRLTDEIPDDAAATRTMAAYKEYVGAVDIIFFACDTDQQSLELVKNLSRSIDQKLCPVKVLRPDRWEKEESWDLFFSKNPVKLFLATPGFVQLKKGMIHYKRVGDATFLHGTPLILLSAPETYTPKEKILLWNQLCTALKT